ncbi:Mut7-C RNAse domain-containing protein [Pontibacter russatus]|uniref:Mut7-C RNAse domain-containing protein n=1 Tax=Pontibacter russatus TaxID=2694929 RepID=UPI00137ACF82|nr:Mut7-C RNAse domain-containing protein [Pontibacter russatus]
MDNSATFTFYGSLNDFLPRAKREMQLLYRFAGAPAVKDAIEALGVPHPEVAVILINEKPVGFYHSLQPGDTVAVYPAGWREFFPADFSLRSGEAAPEKFVLDVHLGRLARALRMLGFDSCYRNDYTDQDIAHIAQSENRTVLTRDVGLLKQKSIQWGYWLRSQHLEAQLQEVITYFNLQDRLQPFSRCIACNGTITEVPKESVIAQLPPKTRLYFHEFYQCTGCNRVYWKGSHYDRMQRIIEHWI